MRTTLRPVTARSITSMARCSLIMVLSLALCHGYTSLRNRSVLSTPQIKLRSEFAPCTIFVSTKRSRALKPGTNNLSMHMGHSHSHNHHHSHSHDHTKKRAKRKVPKGWRGKLMLLFSRPAVRIVFATLITLLPPIIKQRAFRLTR